MNTLPLDNPEDDASSSAATTDSSLPLQGTRGVGLLVIEVSMSNPNGDPDKESDPRSFVKGGKGIISGVSFKRKLRDLILAKDGPAWAEIQKKYDLDKARFDILEDRNLKRDEVKKLLQGGAKDDLRRTSYPAFHKRFWDARLFGNTFLEGTKEEGSEDQKANLRQSVRNGVAQFTTGFSVAPIQIERMTNTKKAGAQEGKDRGMAPLGERIVRHGVYTMPFFVNPALAGRTHCTAQDVQVMLELLRAAYPLTISRARPCVEVRHAFYAEHKSVLGSFKDLDLIRHFTPKRKEGCDPEKPSESWDEYEAVTELGPFEGKVASFKDWAEG